MSSNKAALGEPEHLYHIGKGLKPSAGVTITLQNGMKVKGASRPASMKSDGDGSHRTHPSQVSPRSGAGEVTPNLRSPPKKKMSMREYQMSTSA